MDTIAHDELKQLIERDEDRLVINALTRSSYEAEHIPGSISVPVSEPGFVDRVRRQTTGSDQRIITYCAGPACDASHRAAALLREAGFSHVVAYTGGMEEWKRNGHPVVSGVAAL